MVVAAPNSSRKSDFKSQVRSGLLQGTLPTSQSGGQSSNVNVPAAAGNPVITTPATDPQVVHPDLENLEILDRAITEVENLPVANLSDETKQDEVRAEQTQASVSAQASIPTQVSTQDQQLPQNFEPIPQIQDPLTGQDPSMGQMAQALPQMPAQPEPVVGGSGLAGKERAQTGALEITTETGGGSNQVEFESSPEHEIPVEVDAYLKKVEDNPDQLPQEIAIADNGQDISISAPKTKKVVMVPVTPELEKKGKSEPTSSSLRWLTEWSQKVMKMFRGDVVYWHDEN